MITWKNTRAFTLVEIMVSGALFTMVGSIAYYILNAGTVLYAKNYSINASGSAIRYGLDRVNTEVAQATDLPSLVTINSNGSFSVTSMSTTVPAAIGPAAGIIFDEYRGGPYVMDGNAAATAATFGIKRSTNALVIAPIPSADDILLIDSSKTRPRVASTATGSTSNQIQALTVTLRSGSTAGTSWYASENKVATLVRRVALIVVGRELRFYPTMEGATTYNTSATPYIVLSKDIGTGTGEDKPFSLILKNGKPFLNLSFRVQNADNDAVLAKKESKEYNTSLRIDTLIRPRNAH